MEMGRDEREEEKIVRRMSTISRRENFPRLLEFAHMIVDICYDTVPGNFLVKWRLFNHSNIPVEWLLQLVSLIPPVQN